VSDAESDEEQAVASNARPRTGAVSGIRMVELQAQGVQPAWMSNG
jgi:hypothetical protein